VERDELILWTFVPPACPSPTRLQKRLKQMLDAPLDKTYRVALQAMILEELDRVAYQLRIWQCAQFLVDNQCLNGQWLYGTPTEMPKGVPTPARPPVPTAAKLDADGRRVRPKVVRKLIARKTRDGPAEGDNSNSQYAALGLRACFDAGIAIPGPPSGDGGGWRTSPPTRRRKANMPPRAGLRQQLVEGPRPYADRRRHLVDDDLRLCSAANGRRARRSGRGSTGSSSPGR
jgi:hypothetical protein